MRQPILLLLSLLTFSLGCSAVQTPTAPAVTPERLSDISNRQLWGLYDVYINTETLEASVVRSRTAGIRLNVNTFMNAKPATLGLSIVDATNLLTTGDLVLDVSITHPISNKPKLAGFDVHCVLLSDATSWLNYDDSLTYPVSGSNTLLMNPDGWTRWYNAVEFTTPGLFGYVPGLLGNIPHPQATLNGYKLYADNLGATANPADFIIANKTNRAIFTPGTKNTRRWSLKFPVVGGKPSLKYQYAVLASWAKPSSDNPTPADFPPAANIQEAAHLRVDTSESTLYYTPSKSGGDLVVKVDIFDWQGGTDMQAQVSRIVIESPVLTDSFVDAAPTISQMSGDPFGTYAVTLPSDHVDSTLNVGIWIAVESANPSDYDNGVGAAFPSGKPLTAFVKATASVSDTAPPEPPQIISGIDIDSGTTRCPDRSSDSNAIFSVTATSSLPLSYVWNIVRTKTESPEGDPVPGYADVPGDGAGHLNVDFTDSVFAAGTELLKISCVVTDGVNPEVGATDLEVYLDCIILNANLDNESEFDNRHWSLVDNITSVITSWTAVGATDAGTKLQGKGALWQNFIDFGPGISINQKGMLLTPSMIIPSFLSSAVVKVNHSYSFDPITMGGNIHIGESGTLASVSQPFKPIASGHGYDGVLTDSTNAMFPQSVFSASGVSGEYDSTIDIPLSLIGLQVQVGFAAASGASGIADGGWLIDSVMVIGEL